MSFEPIAIVGQGCVLPGALRPEELWDNVLAGRDELGSVPDGYWRLDPSEVLVSPEKWSPDKIWSDRGGYVRGFDRVFDPEGFSVPSGDVLAMDEQFHWVLHVAREALRSTAFDRRRAGLVVGNLAYPTFALSRYAESVWLEATGRSRDSERPCPHPLNRFHAGMIAHFTARALGLAGEAFALDAACASSLYAIKLACDALHDRRADLMLAGAVNRCDDLLIHAGFCSLGALSRTGRSRPFHRDADGLVPAEGAVLVALKRLDDAIAAGDTIVGVIRGVGLSNDGKRGGLLTPSMAGQVRAMRQAYRLADIDPRTVSLVECHATGTAVGDGAEGLSLREVFAGADDLPLGSLKSNLGHLITAAGAAGLLKVLGAFRAGIRPPTLHAETVREELTHRPLRVLQRSESWKSNGPRRAAVNAFGFGGANAHLIVEEWQPRTQPTFVAERPKGPIAVVSLAVRAGGHDTEGFANRFFGHESGASPSRRIEEVVLDARSVNFPPRDLERTLAQQLVILECALEAAKSVRLPAESTAVYVGMQCDGEVPRCVARIRLEEPQGTPPEFVEACRDAFVPRLEAAAVVGAMPNVPANRINSQLELGGPGFTVASEELSGLRALEIATRSLRVGEIDAAVVGAVDLCCEPVHTRAASEVLPSSRGEPGDAAVVLVLKRLDDARRDGDVVHALIDEEAVEPADRPLRFKLDEESSDLADRFGHAHAASGLLLAAAAILAVSRRLRPTLREFGPSVWLSAPRSAEVAVTALGGQSTTLTIREDPHVSPAFAGCPFPELPQVHVYSGADRAGVLRALERDEQSDGGSARLVLVARGSADLTRLKERARDALQRGDDVEEVRGVFYRDRPLTGRLAFVGSSAVTTYSGMGSALLWAFPETTEAIFDSPEVRQSPEAQRWWDARAEVTPIAAFDKLAGGLGLIAAHGVFTRNVLGLRPDVAMGLSSGEKDVLFASGLCDLSYLPKHLQAVHDSGLMSVELSGQFAAARRAWQLADGEPIAWSQWRIMAPVEQVRDALIGEARVHLAIIHAPGDLVIAGDRAGCLRVLARLGKPTALEVSDYALVFHVPETRQALPAFHRSHLLPVVPQAGISYHVSTGDTGPLTPDNFLTAYLAQATGTVDFPALVERVWNDGARIFVEHGPHNLCSRMIKQILRGREHLAIALDVRGSDSLLTAAHAIGELLAAGVPVDYDAFNARVRRIQASRSTGAVPVEHPLRFPAHLPPIVLPEFKLPVPTAQPREGASAAIQSMEPAPTLMSAYASTSEEVTLRDPMTADGVSSDALSTLPHPVTSEYDHWEFNGLPQAALEVVLLQSRVFQNHMENHQRTHLKFLEIRDRLIEMAFPSEWESSANDSVGLTPRDESVYLSETESTFPEESMSDSDSGLAHWEPAPDVMPSDPGSSRSLSQSNRSPSAAHVAEPLPQAPRGPAFDREQLLVLSKGKISSVFGPLFAQQDGYERQVRLPAPPLLLADRILGIDAEPGVHGKGTIWTETDVRWDSWYLQDGVMPAGIMIESGQADLTLISWMGTDFLNRGERVYRLLGCDLTYHGGLPRPGETIRYEIHIDGHAKQGDVRLFFFHYDGRVDGRRRISVRNGQAGFFSDQELAESAGILWSPETGEHCTMARLDPPAVPVRRSAFTTEELTAYYDGRVPECFGPGYELLHTHTRTPRAGNPSMRFLHEITHCNSDGGPWGRGYLRARTAISPSDWFFEGHFHNDPCMPGTLMFEGTLQAMAFYLTWLGYTLDKDGWRFEPVPDEEYKLRCRGQTTPQSREMICELFIEEVHDGPQPTLYADLLGTVDGLKAFHCRRMGLRLIPDWPLNSRPELLATPADPRPFAIVDDVRGDYPALLACAWGKPSDAFGSMYHVFDGVQSPPRLPGPPYHFMSRITRIDARRQSPRVGDSIELEYDVPPDAWYFNEPCTPSMPFCVLLEANLQPCGWLACFLGFPVKTNERLFFRNLNGSGVTYREIGPGSGTLQVKVTLTDFSEFGGLVIVSFVVATLLDEQPVCRFETSFGFFTAGALAKQVGLRATPDEVAALNQPSDFFVDLTQRPARYFGRSLRLPEKQVRMIDRITGYWPTGGKAGLGRLRSEQTVDPAAWYFKAHFFQDPVQPGSLGLEAMLQLLQFYMVEKDMDEGISHPIFEPIASDRPFSWKYRGQVVPRNAYVQIELEVVECGRDEHGSFAVADAWLWVDGLRIYQAQGLALSIRPGQRAS